MLESIIKNYDELPLFLNAKNKGKNEYFAILVFLGLKASSIF